MSLGARDCLLLTFHSSLFTFYFSLFTVFSEVTLA